LLTLHIRNGVDAEPLLDATTMCPRLRAITATCTRPRDFAATCFASDRKSALLGKVNAGVAVDSGACPA